MGAIAKYHEDNVRIAEERMQEKATEMLLSPENIRSVPTQRPVSKKLNPQDEKLGEIEVATQSNSRRIIRLYIRNRLSKKSLELLYANGWKWNKIHQCWYHHDLTVAYPFARAFLNGDI